jgi:hypothetical protein
VEPSHRRPRTRRRRQHPAGRLLHLLLGNRSIDDLERTTADCLLTADAGALMLDVLFPPMPMSTVSPSPGQTLRMAGLTCGERGTVRRAPMTAVSDDAAGSCAMSGGAAPPLVWCLMKSELASRSRESPFGVRVDGYHPAG